MTYNCKNIKTAGKSTCITELLKIGDIFLLQETWLFQCELSLLNEEHDNLLGVGKCVDSDNPIPPSRFPRRYGGVAVLWKREMDSFIRSIPDGNQRIQCIELSLEKPLLLVCVYMPTKQYGLDEYLDCFDQLNEICQKYKATHEIIVGVDFNENISVMTGSLSIQTLVMSTTSRADAFRDFIRENGFTTEYNGPTFMNVYGAEVSEIDYFYMNSQSTKERMYRN